MDRIWLNETKKLEFRGPRPYLIALRALEREIEQSDLPDKPRHLRDQEQRIHRQRREGALFCYGMGERIGTTV